MLDELEELDELDELELLEVLDELEVDEELEVPGLVVVVDLRVVVVLPSSGAVVVVVSVGGGVDGWKGGSSGLPHLHRVTGCSPPGTVVDPSGVDEGTLCEVVVDSVVVDSAVVVTSFGLPMGTGAPVKFGSTRTAVPATRRDWRAYARPSCRPWFVTSVSVSRMRGSSESMYAGTSVAGTPSTAAHSR